MNNPNEEEEINEKHRNLFLDEKDVLWLLAYLLGWLVVILVFAFIYWR